jgi:hypothetical protein
MALQREPRTIVPGQKPIVKSKLSPSFFSLAKRSTAVYWLCGSPSVELVSGNVAYENISKTKATPNGLGSYFSPPEQNTVRIRVQGRPGTYKAGYTFFAQFMATGGYYTNGFAIPSLSSHDQGGAALAIRCTGYNGPLTFGVEHWHWGGTNVSVDLGAADSGKVFTIAVTRPETADGVVGPVHYMTGDGYFETKEAVGMWAPDNGSQVDFFIGGDESTQPTVLMAAGFYEPVSIETLRNIVRNPYQFLIPA